MGNQEQIASGKTAVVGTKRNLRSLLTRDDVVESISALADKCMSVESIREQTLW